MADLGSWDTQVGGEGQVRRLVTTSATAGQGAAPGPRLAEAGEGAASPLPGAVAGLRDAALAQRGHLLAWVPVCLACGIGGYFAAPAEPGRAGYLALAVLALAALLLARRVGAALAPLAVGIVLVAMGAGLAGWRAHAVAEPVLGFRYYGPVEGRIVGIDRSASDALRLTLDRVRLDGMSPARTPARVRVSLHGDQRWLEPETGLTVILTGHLGPPSGPAEPGGFDFRRAAWFAGIGAIGYTRTPVLPLAAPAEIGPALGVTRIRLGISGAVQAELPGETGAFAAAIMTGDRAGMSQETLAALRASNLAHLLAISGLHMGLLTGFVFALIRYGCALVPPLALRLDSKKPAAAVALVVAAVYLALSGGNVATERAFIMVAVFLVAVLLGRRALTLRGVAVAAVIVLALRPEALTGPGFQMSFAATVALIAVFGALQGQDRRWLPAWLRPVAAVVLSSLVAGLATAPIAAAHFNIFSHYGLAANLLSVPLMGALVMPAAVLAACLAPFGLAWIGLWMMDLGLRWILGVAHAVAGLEGAVGHVPVPHPAVLPVLALGLCWMILWQGRLRLAGLLPVALAFGLWTQSTRPALLVAESGALVGVMTPEGRALSKPRGDGFAAEIWLENDGAPVPQDVAHGRGGMVAQDKVTTVRIGEATLAQVAGKTALAALEGCGGADILIATVPDDRARPCEVYDARRLRHTGALAGHLVEGRLVLVTAREVTGDRLWNGAGAAARGRDGDRPDRTPEAWRGRDGDRPDRTPEAWREAPGDPPGADRAQGGTPPVPPEATRLRGEGPGDPPGPGPLGR